MRINKATVIWMASFPFIALLAIANAQAVGSYNNLLSLTNLYVSPNPVIAGSNITISFNLYNSYSSQLSNVNLALTANNQLVNVSPSGSYLINTVGSGVYGGLGYDTFTYKIRVPPTLSSGLYTLNVVANYEAPTSSSTYSAGTSTMPITLYIYGRPSLSFNIVPQGPLIPGSLFGFDLTAVNTGTDTASNVSVQLVSAGGFTVSGQTKFMLGSLAPGQSATAAASVLVSSNISSGGHYITVNTTYSTAARGYSASYGVPVSIATGSPQITVSAESAVPQQLYSGSNQTLTILVQNIGSGTARNLTISFRSVGQVSVQSSASSFFIGSLQAGASATEVITITANSTPGSNSTLPIGVSYSTSNYQQRIESVDYLPIRVSPSAVFQIISVNDSLNPGSAYSPIRLVIKNVGNQPAKQVALSLQSIYPITPVAGNAYIDYLAPGNETGVTFYVNVDQNGLPGSYLLTLYEQWRQSNAGVNQVFSGSNNYYASVYQQPSGSGSAALVAAAAAAIVIIVIAARVIVKRGKAKKRAKQ